MTVVWILLLLFAVLVAAPIGVAARVHVVRARQVARHTAVLRSTVQLEGELFPHWFETPAGHPVQARIVVACPHRSWIDIQSMGQTGRHELCADCGQERHTQYARTAGSGPVVSSGTIVV